jgi:hypothetical protein
MSSIINTVTNTIWAWLPELTTGLRFGTAFIGFCLTATLMSQRLRRWIRRRKN